MVEGSGCWFLTVDGNAHVERHVRRWRSDGNGTKGGIRGAPGVDAGGGEGRARLVRELVGGCCIDRGSGLK